LTSPDLWRCPDCDRTFANRNQTHTCAQLATVDSHLERSEPHVRELFDAFADILRTCGPFEILPEKTRIAFHVRMSFAQLTPRRRHLTGHLVLRHRAEHPRITRVEVMSPRCIVHHFRLDDAIDEPFRELIREAYRTGTQA
jgi:Domain of unknown function (DUF5655)